MKPKKKAEELIKRMKDAGLSYFEAKQCAIIAVDEIINALHDSDEIDMELVTYWQAVKTELEKM